MRGTPLSPASKGLARPIGPAILPAAALAAAACAAGANPSSSALWGGALGLGVGLALAGWLLRRRRGAEVAVWRDAVRIAELTRAAGLGELSAWGDEELGKPMASLLNNVGAARRLLERGEGAVPDVTAAVDEARVAGEQVAHAIRRLRLFMGSAGGRRGPIQLNAVAREVVRLTRREAQVHGVSLRATLDPVLPVVRGDEERLFQMALSLVLAAVEAAAESAGRAVEVRTAHADGRVELAVRDSGRPISEADRPQLFAPFSPLRRGGLGIGLFMARSIVEAHGGQVTAERPEAGALFRVVLPAEAPARVPGAAA